MTKHWTQTKARRFKLKAKKRKILGRHFESVKYDDMIGSQQEAKMPIDVTRVQEQSFRRGLVAAIECVLRELR
jgi:hypothetical protein